MDHVIISSSLVKGGPVYPVLNEIGKEASRHLSFTFRDFEQLESRLPLKYFWVASLCSSKPACSYSVCPDCSVQGPTVWHSVLLINTRGQQSTITTSAGFLCTFIKIFVIYIFHILNLVCFYHFSALCKFTSISLSRTKPDWTKRLSYIFVFNSPCMY